METDWLLIVGTWKTCVTPDLHHATAPDPPLISLAGSGKSVVWFALLRLFTLL